MPSRRERKPRKVVQHGWFTMLFQGGGARSVRSWSGICVSCIQGGIQDVRLGEEVHDFLPRPNKWHDREAEPYLVTNVVLSHS